MGRKAKLKQERKKNGYVKKTEVVNRIYPWGGTSEEAQTYIAKKATERKERQEKRKERQQEIIRQRANAKMPKPEGDSNDG